MKKKSKGEKVFAYMTAVQADNSLTEEEKELRARTFMKAVKDGLFD